MPGCLCCHSDLTPGVTSFERPLAHPLSHSPAERPVVLFQALFTSDTFICLFISYPTSHAATAAAKSLQSCLTLCDPIDGSPPGSRPWDSPGKNTGVGCHFLLQCIKVKREREVAQSCPTLSDPMERSLPGSSIHGIFQTRILEWGAIAFSELLMLEYRFCESRNILSSLRVYILNRDDIIPRGQNYLTLEESVISLFLCLQHRFMCSTQTNMQYIYVAFKSGRQN